MSELERITTETSKSLSKELSTLESRMRTAQKSFLVEGEVLNEICNQELYAERGYGSFELYVNEIFDISVNYAYKRMAAYRVYTILKDNGYKPAELPKTESQCRPLTRLNGDDKPEYQKLIVPAWEAVISHKCRITAKLVEKEVNRVLGKGEPTEPKEHDETPATPENTPPTPPTLPTNGSGDDIPVDTNTPIDTDPGKPDELPNVIPADTNETAFLRLRIADLEAKLAAERAKKTGCIPNNKLARDMINAGFKALVNTLDDEGKKELLTLKQTMLG